VPAAPDGSAEVAIVSAVAPMGATGGAGPTGVADPTTTAVVAEATCDGLLLSVTVAVKVVVPLVVGMPVTAPVDAVRVSPAGSLPEVIDHV
jgi:hypothetical protein